ncbi:MAG: RNA polymerase sigma factor [Deltaproteobacteria bacterium]|nr:RNA polymerase sigma factor [Deltaproteobacteria bacterium]
MKLVGEQERGAGERLDDDGLMRLVQADRQDAFAMLVGKHQQLVLGLAVRFLGDASLGRDAAQDVFLSLWAERSRYQPRGRFRSYLVSMTLHRCQTLARTRRRQKQRVERMSCQTAEPDGHAELALEKLLEVEQAREVREKLTRLPAKQRQVLILRYTHEMSLEEVAELTGQPLGTVKSHLFRGMKRLQRLLEKGRKP